MTSNKLHRILYFLKYKQKANGKYAIHSPFIYKLYTEVLLQKINPLIFNNIEVVRKGLLKNKNTIEVNDFGTGKKNRINKKIKKITKHSTSPTNKAQILYKLVKFFNPKTILEFGANFGISTSYMAYANPDTEIISIEGCENIAKIAQNNFNILELNNVRLINKDFDSFLKENINQVETHGRASLPEFIYIDGNHAEEATLRYFQYFNEKSNENTIIIFDDIYWSKGMTKAWQKIISNPKVTISIDIYKMGIVLYKKGINKQDFILKL